MGIDRDIDDTYNVERPRKMRVEVICDDCGTTCFVPFQPDPNRPVYCYDCHKKRRIEAGTWDKR